MTALGVGLLGAGPVTQAIHLPVLATLADRLRVVHVMDIDTRVAAAVADRADARHSSTVEHLLDDDTVDIVAICSPHALHAAQTAEVVAAGKRGVLCEKPLATTIEEAQRIAALTAGAGIPLVVGAMHAYDPAWLAATQAWGDLPERTHLVRSRILLPSNDEFVGLATRPLPTPPRTDDPVLAPADVLRAGVLGLATHALPQLRRFLPGPVRVADAAVLSPFGYRIVLQAADRTAELLALMPGAWEPDWTFEAIAAGTRLHVSYPPSYVLAGSAIATLQDGDSTRSWSAPTNGYQAEWLQLADVVDGRAEPLIDPAEAVADMVLALELAAAAADLLGRES